MAILAITVNAKEYHVCTWGNDTNDGALSAPLRTINHAAHLAMPGDTVTVHKGTYREWVDPLYGGNSDSERILYRSFPGDEVIVKGSEPIGNWKKEKNNVWRCTIDNSVLGSENPFAEVLWGDWLNNPLGIHRADIFLDNVSMYEVQSLEKVYSPDTVKTYRDPEGTQLVWFAEVDSLVTTIYANFCGVDPNKHITEASIRPTCFYPTRENLNYITIRGFIFEQAATRWAAPTAEQVGMVSTHWCKGWIIENNIFRNSKCNGLTMGKEAATGDNVWSREQKVDGALHYIEVIFKTLKKGWGKEVIGSHIVRDNTFCDCEQTAMCGSMGSVFSEIYNNHIYNIWVKRQFDGAEIAGIKLHGSNDVFIHNNRIHRTLRGIWLDWMNMGSRVSCNLIYDNTSEDIFCEVDHGPYIIDNNILLSNHSIADVSEGGAIVHNLMPGLVFARSDSRYTPYQVQHSTDIKGFSVIDNGDNRFYNNIVSEITFTEYKSAKQPNHYGGNFVTESSNFKIEENENEVFLIFQATPSKNSKVNADLLGKTNVTRYGYENIDGTPFSVETDYFASPRSESPTAGPFESPTTTRLKVW